MWRCHQLLLGFLVIGHLSRMSRKSRRSANDNTNSEMKPEAIYRSPCTYLKAEEKPGKNVLDSLTIKLHRQDRTSRQIGKRKGGEGSQREIFATKSISPIETIHPTIVDSRYIVRSICTKKKLITI